MYEKYATYLKFPQARCELSFKSLNVARPFTSTPKVGNEEGGTIRGQSLADLSYAVVRLLDEALLDNIYWEGQRPDSKGQNRFR